ncbi:unnamed protein product [Brassicogethes aeneus]|uniref:HAT C-terminal dimerisation domain-containing protein n=1 Tax=Brassicogethes aeneus TaxID=1431903 RepID=A0A9P0BFG9_BRAAE|nr:unnamed protein product [Brassicogethes aeneus]
MCSVYKDRFINASSVIEPNKVTIVAANYFNNSPDADSNALLHGVLYIENAVVVGGEKLTEEQIAESLDFITEKVEYFGLDGGKLIANLAQYRTRTGFFSRESIWKCLINTNPDVWWQGLCTTQPLTPFASRLLNGIPSSAACERNWSAHGNIHTSLRNRLSGQRVFYNIILYLKCSYFYCFLVEKLVAVQCNLKVCSEDSAYEYAPRPYPLIVLNNDKLIALNIEEEQNLNSSEDDSVDELPLSLRKAFP